MVARLKSLRFPVCSMTDDTDYVTDTELAEDYDYFVDVFALKACEPLGLSMDQAADHLDRAYDEMMEEDGERLHATVTDGAFPEPYREPFAEHAAEQFVRVLYGIGDGGEPGEEQVDKYNEMFADLLS